MSGLRVRDVLKHVMRSPTDAVPLVRAGWRLRQAHWWRRAPFLPLPGRAYWEFRVSTAIGSSGGAMRPDELVRAARWALRQPVGR